MEMSEIDLTNSTPFATEYFFLIDEKGADLLVLVVKATYQIKGTSELERVEQQVPVNLSGEFHGEPGKSSFRYEPEVAPVKVATDVALLGHAYPERPGANHVDVTMRVGSLQKTVRVYGDRFWTKTIGLKGITAPKRFDKIPLVYERAFGGWDRTNPDPKKHVVDHRNPVGTGFRHRKYGRFVKNRKLPNLEDPKTLIKRPNDAPPPAGFGFICPEWQPRMGYAGTYDDNWMNKTRPLLPNDFDRRYYNAANPDLIAQGYLKGTETVEIANASNKGPLKFNLPGVVPPIGEVILKDGTIYNIDTSLDTVIINTDEDITFLIWRGNLSVSEKIHDISSVKVSMREQKAN